MFSASETEQILNNLSDTFIALSEQTKSRALFLNELDEFKEGDLAPNGKPYRTFNKSEIYEKLNLRQGSSKLDSLVKKLTLNTSTGRAWRVNLLDRILLQRAIGDFPKFERSKHQSMITYVIGNLKGGAGKTTCTATLATGIASEATKEYRIGVIDLDPQGTCTRILLPKMSPDQLSVGDLLIEEDLELDVGETLQQAVQSTFCKTNYPNLKILPASEEDTRFELYSKMKGIEAAKAGQVYTSSLHLSKILDAVRDDFDILFIDTPPHMNEINIAAHYVANRLIIPLKATENDRDSTGKYLKQLTQFYTYMKELGHKGYDSINILPSAVNTRSSTEVRIANSIKQALGSYVLDMTTYSEPVVNTNEDLSTIFDISGSFYSGKNTSLYAAQSVMMPLISSIEAQANEFWRSQEKMNGDS